VGLSEIPSIVRPRSDFDAAQSAQLWISCDLTGDRLGAERTQDIVVEAPGRELERTQEKFIRETEVLFITYCL
jgi:hypothetical protein